MNSHTVVRVVAQSIGELQCDHCTGGLNSERCRGTYGHLFFADRTNCLVCEQPQLLTRLVDDSAAIDLPARKLRALQIVQPSEHCDQQLEVGAPITFTGLLTSADGTHLKMLEMHQEGRAKGADVWPQVSCRPLSFSFTMVEPFPLNTSPIFAALIPKSIADRRAE